MKNLSFLYRKLMREVKIDIDISKLNWFYRALNIIEEKQNIGYIWPTKKQISYTLVDKSI